MIKMLLMATVKTIVKNYKNNKSRRQIKNNNTNEKKRRKKNSNKLKISFYFILLYHTHRKLILLSLKMLFTLSTLSDVSGSVLSSLSVFSESAGDNVVG
jgi:hypothetical protein